MKRSDRELDLEQRGGRRARGRSEAAEGGAFGGEEKTSVPCERLSLNFIRDADNTRFRRELRDSCFIREGKRRRAPCIEFQCLPP